MNHLFFIDLLGIYGYFKVCKNPFITKIILLFNYKIT